jgi:membrane-associated protease RseP (regulator of RpoE activity)
MEPVTAPSRVASPLATCFLALVLVPPAEAGPPAPRAADPPASRSADPPASRSADPPASRSAGTAARAPRAATAARPAPRDADWSDGALRDRAWLGVVVTGVEGQDAAPPGVTIARLAPGGPAVAAGLREGDVLVALDGRSIADVGSLSSLLSQLEPGSRVQVVALRGLERLRVALVLGAQPQGSEAPKRTVVPLPPASPPEGAPPAKPAQLSFAGDRERPFLGIETMDLQPGLAAYFGVPPDTGVLVETVEAGSPAEAAGMRAGDVLLRVGSDAVSSGAGFVEALRRRSPGERVKLHLVRDRRPLTLDAPLGSRSIPVWVMDEPPLTPERSLALRELAEHQRREADRLQVLVDSLQSGRRPLGTTDATSRPAPEDLDALKRELEALRSRVRELEARLR